MGYECANQHFPFSTHSIESLIHFSFLVHDKAIDSQFRILF